MTPPTNTEPRPDLYIMGGALKASASSYVLRPADTELPQAIRKAQFCYVLTPRQMGKTSLMVRAAAQLKNEGVRTVIIDLTQIGTGVSPEQWYLGHLKRISHQLELKTNYRAWWKSNSDLGILQRFLSFLSEVVLQEVTAPVVIFIDEIDTTLGLNFTDDYFAAIRSLYNERASNSILGRLTFVLLGVASPSDLIKDPTRTPFNVGSRVELTDFTYEEARPLLCGLAPSLDLAELLLRQVLVWTGGHPYLTQKICRQLAEWAESSMWNPADVPAIVDDKVRDAFFSEAGKNTDDNLQFVRTRVLDHPQSSGLLLFYSRLLLHQTVTDDERDDVRVTLKLSGLVKATDSGLLSIRNLIYERVFDDIWVRSALEKTRPVKGLGARIADFLGKGSDERKLEKHHFDAYISYARRDAVFASRLVAELTNAGLKVFLDRVQIAAGADWSQELRLAISDSRSFIAIVSPAYVLSDQAQTESSYALSLRDLNPDRLIIPLLLKDAEMPRHLYQFSYLDFRDSSKWVRMFSLLIRAIEPRLGKERVVTRTGAKPAPAFGDLESRYDSASLRGLLDEAYDDDDLVALAYDTFRPVYATIKSGVAKKAKIQIIIEIADETNAFDKLLDYVARTRPDHYRRFARRLVL